MGQTLQDLASSRACERILRYKLASASKLHVTQRHNQATLTLTHNASTVFWCNKHTTRTTVWSTIHALTVPATSFSNALSGIETRSDLLILDSWMCADPCRRCAGKYAGENGSALGAMHQAGMSVSEDQQVERVSSVPHISCVPEAHQAACPSPSYPWVRLRLSGPVQMPRHRWSR